MKKSKPTSWSYSRLKTFETCAAQYRYRYLLKIPEPPSTAMDRGTAIHEELERYIMGRRPRLSPTVAASVGPLKKELAAFRRDAAAEAEVELAVDRRWRVVDWRAPTAWLRAKLDVRAPVASKTGAGTRIVDHKTGGQRPSDHTDQLELYAVMEFSINKDIDYVVAEIFYIDHGQKLSALYDSRKTALGRVRDEWIERAETMFDERAFEPSPSRACNWCPFARSKGGPCEEG